jgi:hypothetical protein
MAIYYQETDTAEASIPGQIRQKKERYIKLNVMYPPTYDTLHQMHDRHRATNQVFTSRILVFTEPDNCPSSLGDVAILNGVNIGYIFEFYQLIFVG